MPTFREMQEAAAQAKRGEPVSASCRSCDAPILFAFSWSTGRRMPVDVEPSPLGNIALDMTGTVAAADVLTGDTLTRARDGDRKLYLSHFVSCPDADAHRKNGVHPETGDELFPQTGS